MTKPILWLGSVENPDADYDPLLGRSAKDPVRKSTYARATPLAPDQSVFDEPDLSLTPPPPVATPSVFEPAPIIEPAAIVEETVEPLDFTHNNEAIPERLAIEPQVEDLEPLGTTDGRPSSNRSFFTRLFANKPLAAPQDSEPTSTQQPETPAPDEDIWARIEADNQPTQTVLEEEAAPFLNDADTVASEGLVDDAISAPQTDTSAVPEPEPASEPDLEPVIDAPAVDTDEPAEIEHSLEDVVETPKQAPALPSEPLAPVVEAIEDSQAAPETVAALDRQPDEIDPEATSPDETASHPFSRAFNADNFWTVQDGATENTNAEATPIVDVPDQTQELDTQDFASPPIQDEPILEAPVTQAPQPDTPADVIAAITPPIARQPRRRKKQKKNYVGAFFGTFFFGVATIMTLVSYLDAFGYPFDLIASYRWYWVTLGVVAAAIWGVSRGWIMVAASFLVIGANLFVTVPASGDGPVGGKMAAAVIGWANVEAQPQALARVFKDADAKGATLLMVAEAPASVFQPPAGWSLIEAPVANDPTAIAVLSKGSWRAATVPGEPTMARPPAGDITIIGLHPQNADKGRRSTPARDALINRGGARAGIQDGPTVVLGDFNAAPWDRAMRQFRDYGNVTRVRCGGWVAGTSAQLFGLISVATDHAYVRDVKVTHCRLGATLPGGHHKPIWLYVAPQATTPAP